MAKSNWHWPSQVYGVLKALSNALSLSLRAWLVQCQKKYMNCFLFEPLRAFQIVQQEERVIWITRYICAIALRLGFSLYQLNTAVSQRRADIIWNSNMVVW